MMTFNFLSDHDYFLSSQNFAGLSLSNDQLKRRRIKVWEIIPARIIPMNFVAVTILYKKKLQLSNLRFEVKRTLSTKERI